MNPRAGLYMLVSAVAFAAMYIIAKKLQAYGGFTLTFFRGLGTFVIAVGYLMSRNISPLGTHHRLLLARGVTGALSLTFFFFAIRLVPITAAVAIRYLSPLFAIVLTMILLRERVRPIQWLFFAMAFGGVLLLQGVDARIGGLGLLLILLSAFLGGVTFTLIRTIGQREHPLVIVSYFTGMATLVGACGIGYDFDALILPQQTDWWWLLSLGVVGFIGQLFMTIAMQIEAASKVMPLKYLEAVFLFVLSYFFLEEQYAGLAVIGMLLIITGNLFNVIAKK